MMRSEKEKMLALDSLDELIELVQASVLEIHPWGSTIANMEKPDRLIFDLEFQRVDLAVARDHALGHAGVAAQQRVDGQVEQ